MAGISRHSSASAVLSGISSHNPLLHSASAVPGRLYRDGMIDWARLLRAGLPNNLGNDSVSNSYRGITLALLLALMLMTVAFGLSGCDDSIVLVDLRDNVDPIDDPPGDPTDNPDSSIAKIVITDRTGKSWDITHAVLEYSFEADGFQFGIGPHAIRPILKPEMLCASDPGYPNANDGTVVMGVELNGAVRAYPLSVMSRHEVAIEKFGEAYVAVAY